MPTTAPSVNRSCGPGVIPGRIPARSLLCIFLCLTLGAVQAAPAPPETPYIRIAKLASSLSDGEPTGALDAFDKSSKRYAAIAELIQALSAQTEFLCSIDVVEDKEADNDSADIHHLDLDWYMTLKSRADASQIESRRQRVAVTMQRITSKSGRNTVTGWRITELSPEKILAPITIR